MLINYLQQPSNLNRNILGVWLDPMVSYHTNCDHMRTRVNTVILLCSHRPFAGVSDDDSQSPRCLEPEKVGYNITTLRQPPKMMLLSAPPLQ